MSDLSKLVKVAPATRRTQMGALSCVVPMRNEAANSEPFLRALAAQLQVLSPSWEIVVVNDGSHDGTREAVLACMVACHVRYLELSRGFGKEAALTAGLDAARGDVVVMLDADFQHPIGLIPVLLAKWEEGYEMVYAVQTERRQASRGRRRAAALFYWILATGSELDIPRGAGDFRLLDRKVVDALRRLPERTRFMKGLYAWVGFRSVAVPFEAPPRRAGRSSFSTGRLLGLALAGLTAFSTLPLRVWSAVGALVSVAALAYGAWVIVEDFVFGIDVPGYPTIVVSIMFLVGLQFLSIGMIGEYLARVFDEVKRRPNYLVAEDLDASPIATAERERALAP